MTPDTTTKDARYIQITPTSMLWAYDKGRHTKNETIGTIGMKADRICPFREGTPHRVCWYAGWRGQGLPQISESRMA